MEMEKFCSGCNTMKPLHNFYVYKTGKQKGQIILPCKACHSIYAKEYKYLKGIHKPMRENKSCASYLGCFVSEQVLSKIYKHVKRMSYHSNHDFECDKGFFIDVKSSCLYYPKDKSAPSWSLHIRENKKTDFFLCLLFDNRENLKPMYLLLIPGNLVNSKQTITISNTQKSLDKWAKYMQPLNDVIIQCNAMKESLREDS